MVDLDQSSSAHVFSRVTYHTDNGWAGMFTPFERGDSRIVYCLEGREKGVSLHENRPLRNINVCKCYG